jgi:SAM-dependent methyltransferase
MLIEAGARSVLGVDSSPEAIEAAQHNLTPGFRVELGDAASLPVADGEVDVAVSFETLEHLDRGARFLGELRRVLGDRGVLLLSTPNAAHTRPLDGVPRNPFHVREYTAAELAGLLGEHFGYVELRGQRVHRGLRPCPYWERPEVRSGSRGERSRSLLWKLLARVPSGWRDPAAKAALGHPLLPGEDDFVFDPVDIDGSHVLVAICRP